MDAGADFASSPARILIDFLDPLVVAKNVAVTDKRKYITIAYFNEIAVESEVESGTKIKIPILTETPANQNNMIYAVPELQDNYGVDIAINDEGDFDIAGGDFGTVSGTDRNCAICRENFPLAESFARIGRM